MAAQVLLFAGFIGLWGLAARFEIGRPIVVRSPAAVWNALRDLVASGQLWPHTWSTLQATLIALALAAVIGVATGLGLALSPTLERIVTPYLSALNAAPRIAFGPVFIIIFGIGLSSKVALAFSVVIFVVILNARAGVHAADPDVVRLMEVMGASRRAVFTKLLFPVAIPSIFAGLRLGLIYSLLGVVTSEMIAAREGLGQLVAQYSGNFQLDYVYAVIAVLIVIGTLLNAIAGVVERRLLWWKAP
ncbi:ABC transporter permease [Micromonospora sp. NPDC047074]|uniref:ABC transporter permease n=1 Tax=Micromonospora sp. NPDC047074 TaxID=3154339 RepID=UPI0033E59F5C